MTDQDLAPQTAEDLRAAILARYDSFSGRLQQVARHVLDHPDDLALETLTVIADRAKVQPSAIVRFAKTLGFSGASPMQRLLRDGLLAKHATLGYGERVRRFNASVNRSVEGEAGALLAEFVEGDTLALQNLRQTVGKADIERVAKKYLKLDQLVILVVGQKSDILLGQPGHEIKLTQLAGGRLVDVPLRDPVTMKPMPR